VLFDTRVSHSLAASEYNRRREECAEGVAIARGVFNNITHLRDLSPEMFECCAPKMSPLIRRRCKYVVEENNRVLGACAALASGDAAAFGQYMFRTHEGLRSEYEVSCPELDRLVEIVKGHPAVFGARMMGGGFGGCTVNLVQKEAVREVGEMVVRKYRATFSRDPLMYVTSIGPGTSVITVDEAARD
jgi:galactokinase